MKLLDELILGTEKIEKSSWSLYCFEIQKFQGSEPNPDSENLFGTVILP